MKILDVSVIILTYNESIHIQRCIESVSSFTDQIFVVDSFSTDDTVKIAKYSGAFIFENKWEKSYSKQFNWALQNLPVKTKWILRLDADEYLSQELISEIKEKLPLVSDDVSGIVFPLKRVFLNKEIKRSAGSPIQLLRLFKTNKGICEERWMDEHIQLLEGKSVNFNYCFADHNLNTLSWWIEKHNGYSIREAIDLLDMELGILSNQALNTDLSPKASVVRKRKIKYSRQPLFFRAFVYFIYRYIFKLGFLEGKEGFLWHFLQGWWYRTLVDAKIFEIKKACGTDTNKIKAYLLEHYQIKI